MLLYCFRGIVGDSLTPEMMAKLGGIAARHFIDEGHDTISIAGDYRISTPGLRTALMGGLASGGMTVRDCGTLPSGAIAAWTKYTEKPGCMVTASHNPPEWNGVQFMEPDSHIWWPELENAAKEALNEPFDWPEWDQGGKIERIDDVLDPYVDWLVEMADADGRLKVLLDPGGGAAIPAAKIALERLGMDVQSINGKPDGHFHSRPSEPREEHLQELQAAVVEKGADIGIAFDGDADRIVTCDENGAYVRPDYTIELLCRSQREPGPAVINVGVSLHTMAAVEQMGFSIVPSRWGQTFIAQLIKDNDAVFSAEPDGHFGFPELSLRGDAVASAVLLTSALTHEDRPYSEVINEMPTINIVNDKIEWDDDFIHYADDLQVWLEDRLEDVQRLHDRLIMARSDDTKVIARQSPFDSTLRLSAESYGDVSPEEWLADVKKIVLR
jgi:phosphomannomutase/phosphoglucomutase